MSFTLHHFPSSLKPSTTLHSVCTSNRFLEVMNTTISRFDAKGQQRYTQPNFNDNYSVYNPTEVDDDSQSTVKCPVCDFDIEVAALRDRSEDGSYEAYSMICPVCDENLGERVMRIVQNASSRKRAWKSEKYSIWSGHAAMDDKKHASWGNNHEPMSGSLLSPAMDNVSAPNSNDFLSDDDTISNASDIPIAKSIAADAPEAPDSVDEQDVQERRVRAAVVQELVMSAMFLE